MMKNTLFAGCIAVASAACATAATQTEMSEKAAERLSGLSQTGDMRTCLPITQIRSLKAIDDYHFLTETKGGEKYLNSLSSRCSGASRAGNYIQYKVSGSQLCRGQIITVVDNATSMTTGSCGLNSFERLEAVAEDAK